jgi:hypothetical protein
MKMPSAVAAICLRNPGGGSCNEGEGTLAEVTLSAEMNLGMRRDFFERPMPKSDNRNRLSRSR